MLGQAGWPKAVVDAHIEKMCTSTAFYKGDQARNLLEYLVKQAFKGRLIYPEDVAAEALGKLRFDARAAIVRAAMLRLRGKMHDYYETFPRKHGLRLVIPEETYLVLAPPNDSPQLSVNIPAIASILEPVERAEVYQRVTVRGCIDSLDPDARPWLIVLAPDSFYYPQCRVSRRSPSWECEVRIGRVQWGETDGVEFDIMLAAANVDGDFDLEAYMKRKGDGYGKRLPDTEVIATRRVIRRDIRPGGPTTDRLPPQGTG